MLQDKKMPSLKEKYYPKETGEKLKGTYAVKVESKEEESKVEVRKQPKKKK